MAGDPTRLAGLPAYLGRARFGADDVDPLAPVGPGRPVVSGRSRPVTSAPTQPGDEMFMCPCACNCGNATTMAARKVAHAVSSRYLRCGECARKGGVHAATGPVKADEPADEGAIRAFVAPVNPVDVELDRLADAEQARIHFVEEWETWEASLPEKFRGASLDERVDAANKAAILERLELLRNRRPAGAIIAGNLGAGKTWLAYAYANMALEEGLLKRGEIKHGTEAELLGNIATAPWNERSALLRALLSPRHKMLIIDDVGREMRTKPSERRSLYDEIANMAWANGRALVLTSNLKPGTPPLPDDDAYIAGWVGAAAYSRISTASGSSTISVSDRNMRRQLWNEENGKS